MMAEYVGDWKLTKFHFAAGERVTSDASIAESQLDQGLTSMVRFHPLQCVGKKAFALEVDFSSFCHDGPFHFTSRPESMSHRSPRMLRICTKIAFAILPHMERGSRAGYLHVDDASFVCS